MSYAAIFIPGSGILPAYGNNTRIIKRSWFISHSLVHVYRDARVCIQAVAFLSLRVIFLVISVVLS